MKEHINQSTKCYLIPKKCKICGGRILPIIYGEPITMDSEAYYKKYHRRVILAGCIRYINPDNEGYEDEPVWQCEECGMEYYSKPRHWLFVILRLITKTFT